MLANLFNLVKEEGADSVINNPAVPNEKNDAVLADATHSVVEGLQGELAGGGLQNVLSLFGNGGNNSHTSGGLLDNPIVGNIINNFTNKLSNNHGVPAGEAQTLAGSLIPGVIAKLINRSNDPDNSSFNIGSIIGSLTGGGQGSNDTVIGGFDLQGLINKFSGGKLDANEDGHIGLDDLVSKVTNGARTQQQQNQTNGGGFMGIIKGFMK